MNFEDKYIPEPNSGCWLWLHAVDKNGYGKHCGGKAHRYAYTAYKGAIGPLHVLHKCDQPSCVNPDHLFLGTHSDNMKDAHRKGRGNFSKTNTKFAPDVVQKIRAFSGYYKGGMKLFGISRTQYFRLRQN